MPGDDDLDERSTLPLSGDSLAGETLAPIDTESWDLPEAIGPYRILGEMGRGGMGVVYEAEQESPRRRVALKVIRSTAATDRARRRFAFEAEVLARLDHPGIARILEARHEGHRSWFAMEKIDGLEITAFAEARALDLAARLELLALLCDAVHHAHLNGVVHRDLKPANVLVTPEGQPKVLDFGIARAVDPALQGDHRETRAGEVVGTPAYMSPEQASLAGRDIDGRSDVYTLGVIAYELLSGRLPNDLGHMTLSEMLHAVREVDPPRLSRWDRRLAGDVETIVGKALEKSPTRRYQSAAALADDLRRFLRDEPINARPATASYQLRKFARRNPALLAALIGIAIALFLGATISTVLAVRAVQERNAAVTAQIALRDRNAALILLQARATLPTEPTLAIAWLETLPPHGAWPEAAAIAHEARRRGVARDVLIGHGNEVRSVVFAPDDDRIATGSYDHTIRVWRPSDRTVRVLEGHTGDVQVVAFAPDGRTLASASEDGTLRLWRDDDVIVVSAHRGAITDMAYAPGGAQIATSGRDRSLRLWDADGAPLGLVGRFEGPVEALAFSPDGARLAAVSDDGTALLVTLATRDALTLRGHEAGLDGLAFSPDGRTLATSGDDQTVRLWDTATGREHATLHHAHETRRLAFSPDGRTLAASSRDGRLALWDLDTLAARWIDAHTGPLRALRMTDDGRTVVTGGDDGRVIAWDVASGVGWPLLGHRGRLRDLALHGTLVASASSDGTIRLWDLDPTRRGAHFGHSAAITALAVDAASLVSSSEDGTARRHHLASGRTDIVTVHDDQIEAVVVLPSGVVLTGGRDQTVRRWEPETDAHATWPAPERVDRLAASRDGAWLVAGTRGRNVRLYATGDGTWRDYEGHTDKLLATAFAEDDTHFVTGSADKTARVWRVDERIATRVESFQDEVVAIATGIGGAVVAGAGDGSLRMWVDDAPARALHPHDGGVTAVALLPDGTVVSAGVDRVVRLHATDGTHRDLLGHAGAPLALAVTERHVVSAGEDGAVRVWRIADGAVHVWSGADAPLRRLALAPDGQTLFAGGDDGVVRTWPVWPDTSSEAVRAWMDALTTATLDDTDGVSAPWTVLDVRVPAGSLAR